MDMPNDLRTASEPENKQVVDVAYFDLCKVFDTVKLSTTYSYSEIKRRVTAENLLHWV